MFGYVKEKIGQTWAEQREIVEYVMRDPLLFGDFRNAMNEDEPRFYEDLLDYEAVYSLLLEVVIIPWKIKILTTHGHLIEHSETISNILARLCN